jgi:hypothetical protein
MKELLSALANVKKRRHVIKDSYKSIFKSKYFDINSLIEQVDPLLEKNGLLLLQPIEDGKVVVSVIYHVDTEMSVKRNGITKLTPAKVRFCNYLL